MPNVKSVVDGIKNGVKSKIAKTVFNPFNEIIDQNITDITTTIGSFVVRSIRGKFQRSITFTVGRNYSDKWMEEALYGVLYEYNNIKGSTRLELANKPGCNDGSGMYYRLDDGTHNLKYRNFDILLFIQTVSPQTISGRAPSQKVYTIITYNLSPEFVRLFEMDMIRHRNSLLQIKSDSPTINVYRDSHESDGYTYWEKTRTIYKRKLDTIYIPYEQKKLIIDTINYFFSSKEYYKKHGVAHNLKILLYGPRGTGKDSIAKMIASEWNRNMYYVTGGKGGRFIPNALTDNDEDITFPLFLISDIDKYPFLITDPDINIDKEEGEKESKIEYKMLFNSMINALDGVASGEDRIIIMTTNYIDKIDKETLRRPGRIDLEMEIGYVVPEVFRKYVYDNYNIELPDDIKLNNDKITVAMMQQDVMFMKLTADEFIKKYTGKAEKKGK